MALKDWKGYPIFFIRMVAQKIKRLSPLNSTISFNTMAHCM